MNCPLICAENTFIWCDVWNSERHLRWVFLFRAQKPLKTLEYFQIKSKIPFFGTNHYRKDSELLSGMGDATKHWTRYLGIWRTTSEKNIGARPITDHLLIHAHEKTSGRKEGESLFGPVKYCWPVIFKMAVAAFEGTNTITKYKKNGLANKISIERLTCNE